MTQELRMQKNLKNTRLGSSTVFSSAAWIVRVKRQNHKCYLEQSKQTCAQGQKAVFFFSHSRNTHEAPAV